MTPTSARFGIPFLVGFLWLGSLTACGDDTTGPVPPEELPFPTEVERDGLRFGLYSAVAGDEWVLGAWIKNMRDTTVDLDLPGGCMVIDIVAFQEGEFRAPAWRLDDVPGFGPCITNSARVRLSPGQTRLPDEWVADLQTRLVLGDSLEAGRYRFGSQSVSVGGSGGPSSALIAPEPVWLEPTP